jgi:uncharacterized membrane protein
VDSKPTFSRIKNKLTRNALFIVKLSSIITFSLIIFLFSTVVDAHLQYYGVDVVLDKSGESTNKLTFTFSEPVKIFNFTVLGRIDELNAESIAGAVNCSVYVSGVSTVNCDLPLTEEKRTVEIEIRTKDFTKMLDEKYFFSADYSLKENIDQFTMSLTLPEGMALSEGENKLSFQENSTKVSDGRHIIVIWKMTNITDQPLVFQALYEPVFNPPSLIIYFIAGLVFLAVVIFFIIRKIRKPQDVILSVLDDFEKSVVTIITQSGGEINQRKIVQQTNLSKAKISRVVKALEERGIVTIERMGRTNKVRLVKKKIWTK